MKNYEGFNPKNLDENWWYYLNADSIQVLHRVNIEGKYIGTFEKRIPLRALINALNKEKMK